MLNIAKLLTLDDLMICLSKYVWCQPDGKCGVDKKAMNHFAVNHFVLIILWVKKMSSIADGHF